MPIFTSANGIKKEVKQIYTGAGGVKREIKSAWTGINGVRRKVFEKAPAFYQVNYSVEKSTSYSSFDLRKNDNEDSVMLTSFLQGGTVRLNYNLPPDFSFKNQLAMSTNILEGIGTTLITLGVIGGKEHIIAETSTSDTLFGMLSPPQAEPMIRQIFIETRANFSSTCIISLSNSFLVIDGNKYCLEIPDGISELNSFKIYKI